MRTVIYARCTATQKKEESIDEQVRSAKEYIQQNNDNLIDIYIDRVDTGRIEKRVEFHRMIKDARSKKFDKIVVYDLSRLSRFNEEFLYCKTELKKYNIIIEPVVKYLDYDPDSVILESILKAASQLEIPDEDEYNETAE